MSVCKRLTNQDKLWFSMQSGFAAALAVFGGQLIQLPGLNRVNLTTLLVVFVFATLLSFLFMQPWQKSKSVICNENVY